MKKTLITLISLLSITIAVAQEHPSLIVAADDVQSINAAKGQYPLWDATLQSLQSEMDLAIGLPIEVPVPKDPAGGYTHEQHKANGQLLRKLGLQYQLTNDEKYAEYATDIFLAYAKMYPTIGLHPVDKSYARGKLFWQQLNGAVFLCDAIEGYDCIMPTLTKKERKAIEGDFILPYADFFSIETSFVFNKIHNHGVWAAAAVGMTGMVLSNDELVARAFYGIDESGNPMQEKIDGFGDSPYGFFTQVKELFSPDGYYTEGPYYQRYAMTPFLLFAQSIHQNYPEMDVIAFSDSIFVKAVSTLLDLTDATGEFLPINDHLKGMGVKAPSMVWAVDFLYAATKDNGLLALAEKQGTRTISMGGMELCKAMAAGNVEASVASSQLITDGSKGDQGGLVILNQDDNQTVFKFASQGMNHGHFDRLSLMHFNGTTEVLSDYGAARFVNVKAKEGGRYLPENNTYAKQSVAHNTVVINETSHYNAKWKEGQKTAPELLFADYDNVEIQVVAAVEDNAYEGTALTRVVAVVDAAIYSEPILVDLFIVDAEETKATIDLPFHFNGELMSNSFGAEQVSTLKALGTNNGYEHLWQLTSNTTDATNVAFTWMLNREFYSLTTVTNNKSELIFAKSGANDPHFNLRNEPVFIVRQNDTKHHVFASVLESHGYNNPNTEKVSNQERTTQDIAVVQQGDNYAITLTTVEQKEIVLLLSLDTTTTKHVINISGKTYQWNGNYKLIK